MNTSAHINEKVLNAITVIFLFGRLFTAASAVESDKFESSLVGISWPPLTAS